MGGALSHGGSEVHKGLMGSRVKEALVRGYTCGEHTGECMNDHTGL